MNARRLLLPVLAVALAACTGASSGSTGPGPSAPAAATVSPTPALTPVLPPASSAPTSGPTVAPSEPEAVLLHGARLDLQGTCAPVRDGLPEGAVGAVACTPASDVASRVTITAFDTRAALRAAYEARVTAEAIGMRTHQGRCLQQEASEGAYVPGDDRMAIDERGACWADVAAIAHYLATRPPFVLLEVEGRAGGTIEGVERFAWLGNQDQPGSPTLWAEEPLSPEK
jgi:hypothetical protein